MSLCDEAKNKFEEFKNKYEDLKSSDLSESDTRSKVIDFVLKDILGWNEDNIQREEHVDHGYYDYRLDISGFRMVVEAKKLYKDFQLPNTTQRKCKLSTIYKENEEVINQIRGYLDDLGCDTGVITNGRQFIIAKFINTNGVPWKNNDCLLFRSIDDINDSFVEFYNVLSRESVLLNCGISFFQSEEIVFSKTILSTLSQKNNEISRNQLSSELMPIINNFFGELFKINDEESNIDFIKECYVENEEVKKHKDQLNSLFDDCAPRLKEVVPARNSKSLTNQINDELINSPTPPLVVIIGSKGAGKTTFINYLFKENLPQDTLSKQPYIYLNMMKYYDGTGIDFDNVAEDAIKLFDQKYPDYEIFSLGVLKQIYRSEILKNEKGVWSLYKDNQELYNEKLAAFLDEKQKNHLEHLVAMNQYFLKNRQKRLILVFDNADQLSDDVQNKVFLTACSLNKNGKYGVFLSLREGYYYKWRTQAPFNAFEYNAYHIVAPKYGQILRKRIDYVLKNVDICRANRNYSGDSNGKVITLTKTSVEEFFIGIRNSLFLKDHTPIIDFINFSTFPDIRSGLDLFKTFLTSGYAEVEEYVLRVGQSAAKRAVIPMHEFIQTIGLENKLYYNHEISKIPNLFYPAKGSKDHFLKIFILLSLKKFRGTIGNQEKFIDIELLKKDFIDGGYKENLINQEISFLLNQNFVETDTVLSDTKWDEIPAANIGVAITAKGMFYIETMINHFYYIDLVLQDTPFFVEDDFLKTKELFPLRNEFYKRDMDKRIGTLAVFMEYLDKQEEQNLPKAISQKYGKIIKTIVQSGLKDDVERICAKIQHPVPVFFDNDVMQT